MSFAKFKHDFMMSFFNLVLKFMPASSYMLFAGEGSARGLCQSIGRSGLKRLLVVTDKPLVELGIVERALSGLSDSGVETFIYDGVMPDPTFQVVGVLAGFTLLTAFIFHNQLGDQMQFLMFMKNIAMAGGFLFLVRHGAGELSLDNRRSAAAINTSA